MRTWMRISMAALATLCCLWGSFAEAKVLRSIDDAIIIMDGIRDMPTGRVYKASEKFTKNGYRVYVFITDRKFSSLDGWEDFVHGRQVTWGIRDSVNRAKFKADVICFALTGDGKYSLMETGDRFKETALRYPSTKGARTALMSKVSRIAESGEYDKAFISAIKGANRIMNRGFYIFWFFFGGAILISLSALYFFMIFLPRRRYRLAVQKSRANIASYRERSILVLASFSELFRENVSLVWGACDGERSSFDGKFQEMRQAVDFALEICFTLHGNLQNDAELDELGLSELQAVERGLVGLLVQILGTKALNWDLERLQEAVDFMQGLDSDLLSPELVFSIHDNAPTLERWGRIDLGKYGMDEEALGIFDYIRKMKALVRECQTLQRKVKKSVTELVTRVEIVKIPQIAGFNDSLWRANLLQLSGNLWDLIKEIKWSEAQIEVERLNAHLERVPGFAVELAAFSEEHQANLKAINVFGERGYEVSGAEGMEVTVNSEGVAIFAQVNEAICQVDLATADKLFESLKRSSSEALRVTSEHVALHEQNCTDLDGLKDLFRQVKQESAVAEAAFGELKILPEGNLSGLEVERLSLTIAQFLAKGAEGKMITSFEQNSLLPLESDNSLEGKQYFADVAGRIKSCERLLQEHRKLFQTFIGRNKRIVEMKRGFADKYQEIGIALNMVRDRQKYPDEEITGRIESAQRNRKDAEEAFGDKEYILAEELLEKLSVELDGTLTMIKGHNSTITTLEETVAKTRKQFQGKVRSLAGRYKAMEVAKANRSSVTLAPKFNSNSLLPNLEKPQVNSFNELKKALEDYNNRLFEMMQIHDEFAAALEGDEEHFAELRRQLSQRLSSVGERFQWASGRVSSPRARNYGPHSLGNYEGILGCDVEGLLTVVAIEQMLKQVEEMAEQIEIVGTEADNAIEAVLAEETEATQAAEEARLAEEAAKQEDQGGDGNWGSSESDSNFGEE